MRGKYLFWMLFILMLVFGTFAAFIGIQAVSPGEGSVALIPAAATVVKGSETSVFPNWSLIDLEVRVANVTNIIGIKFSLEWNPAHFKFVEILMGTKNSTDFIYEAGKQASQYYGPGYTSVNSSALHEFYYTQLAGTYGYANKTYTGATTGLVTKLRFNYTGPSPTIGYPIDTSINITNRDLGELMRTNWAKWISGTTLSPTDFSTMLPCHFHYETALKAVHLESEEDTGVSTNLGTIIFDGVSYSLPNDVSKVVGTYSAEYFADAIIHMFYHWETTGLVSVSGANANPATVTVSGNGTLKAIYASHHINHFNDKYVPMVIPFNDKNLTIAPVINCTILENGVFNSFYYPCKSAQTTLTDKDWSDGDANYTYVFEDWVDYDWNDIVVNLYATTNDTIEMRACAHLDSREAAWKNPFGVEITPMGMNVLVYWNSTDYPEEYIVQVNSSETRDIKLFSESNPEDIAFIKIIPIIPPTYTLTITSTSGGTTDPVPDSYSYDEGTVVSVTAVPNLGYIFDHWELDGNVRSANPIHVTMNANHTLHAVFAGITYTLTITTTTGGTTIPPPGPHVYPYGTSVQVDAIPDNGYQLDHWELDGVNVGSVDPYTVTMNADHNLHAIFKAVPSVGGHAIPIDKTHFLAPRIGLTPRIGLASVLLVAMAVTVILIRRKKRH